MTSIKFHLFYAAVITQKPQVLDYVRLNFFDPKLGIHPVAASIAKVQNSNLKKPILILC